MYVYIYIYIYMLSLIARDLVSHKVLLKMSLQNDSLVRKIISDIIIQFFMKLDGPSSKSNSYRKLFMVDVSGI